MAAQLTYIEAKKMQTLINKQRICEMMQISEEQYAWLQYNQGIAYLMWYLPADEDARAWLEADKLYWNWWKNWWAIRDEVFLNNMSGVDDLKLLRFNYSEFNCARYLIADIKPPKLLSL